MQNVIKPPITARSLQRTEITRLFDHTNQGRVPLRVGAERAKLPLRGVAAPAARANLFLDRSQGVGQGKDLGPLRAKQMVREPFGRLGADARQLAQLVHEPSNGPDW